MKEAALWPVLHTILTWRELELRPDDLVADFNCVQTDLFACDRHAHVTMREVCQPVWEAIAFLIALQLCIGSNHPMAVRRQIRPRDAHSIFEAHVMELQLEAELRCHGMNTG